MKFYRWQWNQATKLYQWTWVATNKLCRADRADYSDQQGHPRGYISLARTYTIRMWAGYLIWVGLRLLGYLIPGPDITTLGQLFYIFAPFWMTPLAIVAVSAGLYAITVKETKRFTLSRLGIPVAQALLLVPPAAVFTIMVWLASRPGAGSLWGLETWAPPSGPLTDALGDLGSIAAVAVLPLWLAVCLWIPFATVNLLTRLYWNNFRAIDGHPYLGALSVLVSTWAVVVYDAVVSGPARTLRPDTQLWLQLAVNWGGPVLLTAIAVTEIIWLRRHVGGPGEGSIEPPATAAPAA
jgi:hypothetical protein